HGGSFHLRCAGDQAAGIVASTRSQGDDHCHARRSESAGDRGRANRCAQSSTGLRAQFVRADANSEGEIEAAFANFTGAFTNSHREAIVALAARHAIPAIYSLHEFASLGGLISYGASYKTHRRAAG